MDRHPVKFWNPYVGGLALGLVLLTAYVVMGHGLGASGASFRVGAWAVNAVAPEHAASRAAIAAVVEERHPLDDWLVFEVVGVVIGGVLGAWSAGRLRREALRGPTFGVAPRLALGVAGGVLMGFAAKLSRGCTSGQALSGGALLSVGSWAFMLSVFAGGYAVAYFVRRQWR